MRNGVSWALVLLVVPLLLHPTPSSVVLALPVIAGDEFVVDPWSGVVHHVPIPARTTTPPSLITPPEGASMNHNNNGQEDPSEEEQYDFNSYLHDWQSWAKTRLSSVWNTVWAEPDWSDDDRTSHESNGNDHDGKEVDLASVSLHTQDSFPPHPMGPEVSTPTAPIALSKPAVGKSSPSRSIPLQDSSPADISSPRHHSKFKNLTAFLHNFAIPHLMLSQSDNAIRISQSLYRCASLSAEAQISLTKVMRLKRPFQRAGEAITACAEGLSTLIKSNLLSGVFQLHPRFIIQLVYQTMDFDGAFSALMNAFASSLPADRGIQETLKHEYYCRSIYHSLLSHPEFDLEVAKSLALEFKARQSNPVVTGGCLVALTHTLPALLQQERKQRLSEERKRSHKVLDQSRAVMYALTELESVHSVEINQYLALAKEFHSSSVSRSCITAFVKRGLLINLELPLFDMEYSYFFPYINYPPSKLNVLELFLNAGFNIDQPNPFVSQSVSHLRHHLFPTDRRYMTRIVWFLERGANVDRHYGPSGETVLEHVIRQGGDVARRMCSVLVRCGADVRSSLALLRPEDMELLKVMMEAGHPQLNLRDAEGETALFFLVARDIHVSVLKQLVQEYGLDVHVVNNAGMTASQLARQEQDWIVVGTTEDDSTYRATGSGPLLFAPSFISSSGEAADIPIHFRNREAIARWLEEQNPAFAPVGFEILDSYMDQRRSLGAASGFTTDGGYAVGDAAADDDDLFLV